MFDFQHEAQQAQQAEMLADAIEADEHSGGCSKHRSLLYQTAFAACLALWREQGSDAVFETLQVHLDAEVPRLATAGETPGAGVQPGGVGA